MAYLFLKDRFYLLKQNSILMCVYALYGALYQLYWPTALSEHSLWLVAPLLMLAIPHSAVNFIGGVTYFLILFAAGSLHFGIREAAIIFAGILTGGLSAAFMHNASHYNFKYRWLSELFGEICAFQQIIGFREWQIIHVLYHHRYPDDPHRDPHAPLAQTFFRYYWLMKFKIARSFEKIYLKQWGDTSTNRRLWGITGISIILANACRVSLWFFIMSPQNFLFYFVVSNTVVQGIYCHFNYYTHRPAGDGTFRIVDRNEGLFKFLNLVLFGSYIHKVHHANPRLFNPIASYRPEVRREVENAKDKAA